MISYLSVVFKHMYLIILQTNVKRYTRTYQYGFYQCSAQKCEY